MSKSVLLESTTPVSRRRAVGAAARLRGGNVAGHAPKLARRACLAVPFLLTIPKPAAAQGASLVTIGREGWLFPSWDRMDRVDQALTRQVQQFLAEVVGVLKQARIEVVICLIPSKGRVYRRFLPANIRVSADVDARYAGVAAGLRRAGALVPDLDSALRNAAATDPHWPVFFRADTHWTPVGAEIAAVTIAREMLGELRLPPSPQPGPQLGEVRMMRLARGDLVPMLPRARQGEFGAQESPIRSVAPSGGAASLLDEDVSDVHIAGTSNMQPRFGFTPVLANQIMRPVGLTWRTNNVGAYAALLDFVQGADFRRRRPVAIIWNLLEGDMASLPDNPRWGEAAIRPQDFVARVRQAVRA